ncbi:MAG: ABC transporter ATP-binding protein [bacterium]
MSCVQLLDVTKKFGDVVAVNGINLIIQDGEFFSLLGPSGCGKTTILRLIAGFYTPTFGKILFNGKDVSSLPPNKRNTGMVFQNYALFPHMTVFENVAFGLHARKVPASKRKIKVMKALEMVNLANLKDRNVTQLSGGQQQRVALARAIVINPDILLLDEPLSNLDAKLRRDTRDNIQNLQKELKITTIYVTHDQEEALTLSDRIALINNGVCQQVGTPYEIHSCPANAFVASFIGHSNILNGIVIRIDGNMVLVKVDEKLFLWVFEENYRHKVGESVTLAIRPEAIIIHDYKGNQLNVFKSNIISKQFNGYITEYKVDMQGKSLNVISLNEENKIFNINDDTYVEIPASKINLIKS